MQSSKKETIQSIYLYLVTLVGLFMIVIPAIDIVKMGLETWVFPLANENQYDYKLRPPEPYFGREKIVLESGQSVEILELTEAEQQMFERWKVDFKNWEEKDKNKDYVAISKQRSMVRDISILLGGLVLFLSHGYVLRKKRKEK